MRDYKLMGYCRFDDSLLLERSGQRRRLPQDPKTVIVCLFPYHTGDAAGYNLARFAWVDDYHRVVGRILDALVLQLVAAFPGESFAAFTDVSPIREVRAAALSGLGVIGRHGMLIHSVFGSRVFIGEIVTTLDLAPPLYKEKTCPGCGLCVSSCPTGALDASKSFERGLCRSHISQLKRGLSDWETSQIREGKMAWGCDICADVCPLNRDIPKTFIRDFLDNALPILTRENLAENLELKPYGWRGRDVLLRNLEIIGEDC